MKSYNKLPLYFVCFRPAAKLAKRRKRETEWKKIGFLFIWLGSICKRRKDKKKTFENRRKRSRIENDQLDIIGKVFIVLNWIRTLHCILIVRCLSNCLRWLKLAVKYHQDRNEYLFVLFWPQILCACYNIFLLSSRCTQFEARLLI